MKRSITMKMRKQTIKRYAEGEKIQSKWSKEVESAKINV